MRERGRKGKENARKGEGDRGTGLAQRRERRGNLLYLEARDVVRWMRRGTVEIGSVRGVDASDIKEEEARVGKRVAVV